MRADHGGSFLQHLKMTLVTSEEILERDGPNELEKPPKPTALPYAAPWTSWDGLGHFALNPSQPRPLELQRTFLYDIPTHIPTIFCRKVVRCQKVRRFDLAVAT